MSFKIVERNIGLNARNDIDGYVKTNGRELVSSKGCK